MVWKAAYVEYYRLLKALKHEKMLNFIHKRSKVTIPVITIPAIFNLALKRWKKHS